MSRAGRVATHTRGRQAMQHNARARARTRRRCLDEGAGVDEPLVRLDGGAAVARQRLALGTQHLQPQHKHTLVGAADSGVWRGAHAHGARRVSCSHGGLGSANTLHQIYSQGSTVGHTHTHWQTHTHTHIHTHTRARARAHWHAHLHVAGRHLAQRQQPPGHPHEARRHLAADRCRQVWRDLVHARLHKANDLLVSGVRVCAACRVWCCVML
jgi:hypothetical protein